VDRDNLGHSVILTSMENVAFPKTIVSVVNYLQEKRVLEFEWHQVSRRIWTIGQGFGKNCGLE
jgi:hypothetical protein